MLTRRTPDPRTIRRREKHRVVLRVYRQRVKACRIVVYVEVDGDVLNWLVDAPHWLTAEQADAGDREIIGSAISAGLRHSAREWKERRKEPSG